MVLLHHHIYKNAGTTIDWILRRNFGSRFSEINTASSDGVISADSLSRYLTANPSALAISSHNFRLPLPPSLALRCQPIVIIRHPLDRIASIYEFERRQHSGEKQFNNLQSYVRWALEINDRHLTDPQTTLLANDSFPPDVADACHARELLSGIPHLGVVDRFADSVLLLELGIKREFPWFDGAFRSQNASRPTATPLEARIEMIRDQLGPELFEAVQRQNEYDTLLHHEATCLIDARVSGLADLDQKRSDLIARCSML